MGVPASTVKIELSAMALPKADHPISLSMRMHLIEGGDIHAQDLSKMEEVAAVTPIEYIDRNFRDIVLTLRSSSRNDSLRQGHDFEQYFQRFSQTHAAYVCTNSVLMFHHGTYGRH
ncbi:hypothetical protein BCV71DRAFT_267161 [Rhizopus microsporus]|uniref:Uncharacterized protein n=1 Tax=Rhizopus microsporus TaxID=58291 RepID=A0A1X0RRT6_RHIZD|nr:hypothetical protein BCV71DRAFT_267161 [Rhizopus microsporus]